jgi:D-alanine--poly(phosphoribitol) ligase subunit 2
MGDSAELKDKILHRLAAICGTDEILSDQQVPLFEKQILDSMKTVELILALEQEFGLYVSPAELDRDTWATPQRIVADVERRLK